VKRRISVQSTKNPEQSEESHQLAKAIGILGIKTSFLDKYKLQSMNDEDNFETDDGEVSKKFRRREILCSTKRNKSL
jgi:hypothetical protein